MNAERPTAVIFDVGNVLYGWDPEAFLARQIPEDERRLAFIEETGLWEWHDSLDGGRPYYEAAAELPEKFPDYAAYIAAWRDRSGKTLTEPVPGMPDLAAKLAARAVPPVRLTHFPADL